MEQMTTKELLMDFLKFHYKENQFRRVTTNEKDVDDYLSQQLLQQTPCTTQLPPDTTAEDCLSGKHFEDCNSGCCLFCGVKFIDKEWDKW